MNARMVLLTFAIAMALPNAARAQAVRLDSARGARAQVFTSTGYERALLPLTLGAAMRIDRVPRPLVLGLTWTLPMVEPDLRDRRTRLYAEVDLFPDHGFMLRVAHGWAVTTTENDAFSAVGLVADLGVTAGYSAPRGTIGAELGTAFTLFTSIESSAWARNEAGVPFTHVILHAPAFGLRTGVRAGVVFGPVECSLRFGWDRMGQFSITPSLYAQLGVGVRFGHARHGDETSE